MIGRLWGYQAYLSTQRCFYFLYFCRKLRKTCVSYLCDSRNVAVSKKGKILLKLTLERLSSTYFVYMIIYKSKFNVSVLLDNNEIKVSFKSDKIVTTNNNNCENNILWICDHGFFALNISELNKNDSSSVYLIESYDIWRARLSYDIWRARLSHMSSFFVKSLLTTFGECNSNFNKNENKKNLTSLSNNFLDTIS
jgi:hypothetical protein